MSSFYRLSYIVVIIGPLVERALTYMEDWFDCIVVGTVFSQRGLVILFILHGYIFGLIVWEF